MAKRLTDKYLKSLKPPASGRLVIPDAAAPGLSLRVTATGAQSWLVRFRPRGQKQKGVVLGPYPAVTLAYARQRATKIVAGAKAGMDLIADEQRQAEAEARARARARTVAEVAPDFLRASERLKSYRQRESYTRNHILPHLGDRIVGEVRRADIVELLDAVEGSGLRQTTNRVRETLLALFEFAVERQLADANPVAGSRRRRVEVKRQRVLTPDEIRALWLGLDEMADPVPAFIRTLLLTGVRREEARGARWSEVDRNGALWVIPGSRTKNGRTHEVPLSGAMLDILAAVAQRGPYVFTRDPDGESPLADMSGLKAAVDKTSGITGWRLHDLRRTLRTGLAQLGVIHEIAEVCIGHTLPGLTRTYNTHEYRAEKTEALQRWADHLLGIVAADPGKVLRIQPSAVATMRRTA
jgi:integrase